MTKQYPFSEKEPYYAALSDTELIGAQREARAVLAFARGRDDEGYRYDDASTIQNEIRKRAQAAGARR